VQALSRVRLGNRIIFLNLPTWEAFFKKFRPDNDSKLELERLETLNAAAGNDERPTQENALHALLFPSSEQEATTQDRDITTQQRQRQTPARGTRRRQPDTVSPQHFMPRPRQQLSTPRRQINTFSAYFVPLCAAADAKPNANIGARRAAFDNRFGEQYEGDFNNLAERLRVANDMLNSEPLQWDDDGYIVDSEQERYLFKVPQRKRKMVQRASSLEGPLGT
jgi:hypothetical protein